MKTESFVLQGDDPSHKIVWWQYDNMIFYVLKSPSCPKYVICWDFCTVWWYISYDNHHMNLWWSSYVKNDGQAYNGQREHHFTIYLGKMYHWSLKSQNYCKTIVICFLDLNKLDQAKTQGFWIQLLEYPIPPRHKNCQVPISRKPIDPLVSKQAEKILKKSKHNKF